jgi:hypothetical protein
MTTIHHKTIVSVERMTSSQLGNPRWLVLFTDGTQYRTAPDSAIAYGLSNRENFGVPLEVEIDGRGNIVTMNVPS